MKRFYVINSTAFVMLTSANAQDINESAYMYPVFNPKGNNFILKY